MAQVLLIDDSQVDRHLFTELLRTNTEYDVRSCEDAKTALDSMADTLPDIVLTDMQMPGMDGLELVKTVRDRYPDTPVILITGHGSEELATKALRAGAAGYVPKSHSTEMLTSTIRHVLELGKNAKIDSRTHELLSSLQFELSIENDEALIPGILQLVRQRVSEMLAPDKVLLLQIEVALEHALQNAIYHGNLDFAQHAGVEFDRASRMREAKILRNQKPYHTRRVTMVMRLNREEMKFMIKDDGDGFDVKEVSSLGLSQSLRGDFGQGLFLMWAFMDKVVFDKTGSTVTLTKLVPSAPEPPSVDEKAPQDTLLELKFRGKVYSIDRPRVTLGRDPSCDVVIDSSSASHHHCVLVLHEGWWFMRDLKSKNGTKVNGKKHGSHLLPPNSTLAIGANEFAVDYQPHKLGAHGITPPVDPF